MRAPLLAALTAAVSLVLAPSALADSGQSTNWAGYAAHGTTFRRIEATWVQPNVSCVRGHDTYSAYWVGLGGFSLGSQALEQIGTEADCNLDGTRSLTAWYEMVPAASMPISMTLVPGDVMDADVTVIGHRATLALSDRTRHRAFRVTVGSRQIDVTSAEWIVEAPSDCLATCVTLPLADFGAALFTGARAQATDGHWGGISDPFWSTTRISLIPPAQVASAHAGRGAGSALPSGLLAGGTAFAVTFTHSGSAARAYAPRSAHGRAEARKLLSGRLVHPLFARAG